MNLEQQLKDLENNILKEILLFSSNTGLVVESITYSALNTTKPDDLNSSFEPIHFNIKIAGVTVTADDFS